MKRSVAREQAFILIFEYGFHNNTLEELLEMAQEARGLENNVFMQELTKGTIARLDEIDPVIEKYCVGWKMERIARVSLAIMRLACFELLYRSDIPVGVSIDQAVGLAKKYATEDDASYINGVLGNISRQEECKKDESSGN